MTHTQRKARVGKRDGGRNDPRNVARRSMEKREKVSDTLLPAISLRKSAILIAFSLYALGDLVQIFAESNPAYSTSQIDLRKNGRYRISEVIFKFRT